MNFATKKALSLSLNGLTNQVENNKIIYQKNIILCEKCDQL